MTVRAVLALTAPPYAAAGYARIRLPVTAFSTISSLGAGLGRPESALPAGSCVPTVITPGQARTETMSDPTGNPVRLAVHRGKPLSASYASTDSPKPTTATLPPTAA